MNEDLTQDMPERSFRERVLSELSAIGGRLITLDEKVDRLDGRLTTLEEKVERRLQETRPIWEDVQLRLRQLDSKFDLVIKDLYETRSDQVFLTRRVDQLEKRPPQ